jgi:hypothetical protein
LIFHHWPETHLAGIGLSRRVPGMIPRSHAMLAFLVSATITTLAEDHTGDDPVGTRDASRHAELLLRSGTGGGPAGGNPSAPISATRSLLPDPEGLMERFVLDMPEWGEIQTNSLEWHGPVLLVRERNTSGVLVVVDDLGGTLSWTTLMTASGAIVTMRRIGHAYLLTATTGLPTPAQAALTAAVIRELELRADRARIAAAATTAAPAATRNPASVNGF